MTIVERVEARSRNAKTVFIPVSNYRETPPLPVWPGMTDEVAKSFIGWVYYADSSLWVGSISSSIQGGGIDEYLTRNNGALSQL